jgi:LSD1 subclass zinc finger protein
MENTESDNNSSSMFACTNCGAELKYKPGTTTIKCEYCDTVNEIPQLKTEIEELDFNSYLDKKSESGDTMSVHVVKCSQCGASSTVDPKIRSEYCPYCSAPLIISSATDEFMLQPKYLLPFKIDKNEAMKIFNVWVNKLWFAPDNLKKASLNFDHFKGVYIPYWTYDSDTESFYTGQRGTYYYVTQSYTANVNGKAVVKTRQVRKTRWESVSGQVSRQFDDVLTVASKSLPDEYIYALEPWDLKNLVAFDSKYLSGFVTEKYQTDFKECFVKAKERMDEIIRSDVRNDIGGDEQRILQLDTDFKDITFKHILLPVYVSAYKYETNLFRFLINARTGEVQGERPLSWTKIILAVSAAVAAVALIVWIANAMR